MKLISISLDIGTKDLKEKIEDEIKKKNLELGNSGIRFFGSDHQ